MNEAKSDKSLREYNDKISKADLLILDELGYLNYEKSDVISLFDVISSRHELGSTFFTTNYEFSRWGEFINDKGLVIAINGQGRRF